jgi:hypothetical protein
MRVAAGTAGKGERERKDWADLRTHDHLGSPKGGTSLPTPIKPEPGRVQLKVAAGPQSGRDPVEQDY